MSLISTAAGQRSTAEVLIGKFHFSDVAGSRDVLNVLKYSKKVSDHLVNPIEKVPSVRIFEGSDTFLRADSYKTTLYALLEVYH